MAHSHGHSHGGHDAEVEVESLPRMVLTVSLVLVAVLTVVGVAIWWPDSAAVDKLQGSQQFIAKGVVFETADVVSVSAPCTAEGQPKGCDTATAKLTSGPDTGTEVGVKISTPMAHAGLKAGDQVELSRTEKEGEAAYAFFDVKRGPPLLLLVGLFVVCVVAVARMRGLMAVLGLAFAGAVVWLFLLPALLSGEPAAWVALVSSVLILYVVLYTTHGLSVRTSVALAGTLAGVTVTALIGTFAIGASRLSGLGSENGQTLSSLDAALDLQSLLVAAVIIAGLGALNDVTITQASAVWELRAAGPHTSRWEVFRGAMRIGRDHVASTIYTIVFAYVGSALTLLLVIQLYDRTFFSLLTTEQMAGEIVATMAAGIGVVLAMPITTIIGALTLPGPAGAPAEMEYDAPRRPMVPPRQQPPRPQPPAGYPPTRVGPREQAGPYPNTPPVRGYPAPGPARPGPQPRGDHHGRQRPMGQGAWPPPDQGPRRG
ncbi:YibE/F family protein [Nocardioides sp. NPDC126508]